MNKFHTNLSKIKGNKTKIRKKNQSGYLQWILSNILEYLFVMTSKMQSIGLQLYRNCNISFNFWLVFMKYWKIIEFSFPKIKFKKNYFEDFFNIPKMFLKMDTKMLWTNLLKKYHNSIFLSLLSINYIKTIYIFSDIIFFIEQLILNDFTIRLVW